jgi:alpha-N-acetylglucosamine transferase
MSTAYVTTLCNGAGYVPGVEALGRSLARTDTPHDKLLLVTDDVPLTAVHALCRDGWRAHKVDPIENPNPTTDQFFARFANTFTKLRAFELEEFDKLVLLDADTIALQNIDDLFERPGVSAAPDFLLPDRFNSGVLVIEPKKELFARMMEQLFTSASYDGGDQGFLNTFFPDWYNGPGTHRLPAGYNLHQFIFQFLRAHPALMSQLEREAKVIHYTVQKPWLSTSTLAGGSEAWWDMYFDAHPEQATGWRRRVHAIEDWSFDQMLRTVLT